MKIEQVADPSAKSLAGIKTVRNLLDGWNTEGFRYCHWKSNEHVDASVQGLTDLDVLIDPKQSQTLQESLSASGFRRFQSAAWTAYPGIEDYLAFDEDSGRLVHLHLHYQLTLGQKHLKGYRLPWEERLLEQRCFDTSNGIFVSSPEMELLLHLVRDALKRRLRTTIKNAIRSPSTTGDFRREYDWLIARADVSKSLSLCYELLGPDSAHEMERLLESDLHEAHRRRFSKSVRRAVARHRTVGAFSAVPAAFMREIFWVIGGLNKRYVHRGIPMRRFSPRSGAIVALIGSDGAGKSTACRGLITTFSKKLDVAFIYFGSGDGPSSILRAPLVLCRRVLQPNRKAPRLHRTKPEPGLKTKMRHLGKIVWATTLAFEKRGKLRRMVRARNRGVLVIADRFPQNQIEGFNDGPLLRELANSRSRLLRSLSSWEASVYAEAQMTPPDIVVKLVAPIEVASERRPEMARDEIARRISAVSQLSFPEETKVVEISTDLSANDVCREISRFVWQRL